MRKVDKLALQVAHFEAMRQVAIAAHNPQARDYWWDQREKAYNALNTALREHGYDRPAPKQPPLFIDDIKDRVVARPKRKR